MSGIGGYSDAAFAAAETRWDAEDERRAYPMPEEPKPIPKPREIPIGYIVQQTRYGNWYRVITPKRSVYSVNPSKPECSCPDFARNGRYWPCKHVVLVRNYMARVAEVESE